MSIDKIWKKIKGKNHHHSPARPLPASILPASRLAPVITGMFLLQWPPTSAWISSEICPRKGTGTVDSISVPTVQISLENQLGTASPPSGESVHKGSNWTSCMEINLNYWISKLTRGHPQPSSLLLTSPSMLPFCLKASTWTLKLPSWAGFPLIIKIRMYLVHKGPSVILIQQVCTEHLLCTRQSACLWGFKNQ